MKASEEKYQSLKYKFVSYYSRDGIQSHGTGSGYLRSKDGERKKKKKRAEESTLEAASQSKKR